jgi:magnesium chelatase family protein
VTPVKFDELNQKGGQEEHSEAIRTRVITARNIQNDRFEKLPLYSNAQMESNLIRKYCEIDENGSQLLKNAMNKLNLSARAYDRILKVSRTIADLAGTESIQTKHIAEAIHYRSLDRENWGA